MGSRIRRERAGRMGMSALLLALMAACSYLGAGGRVGEKRVSLPVTLALVSGDTQNALWQELSGISGVKSRLDAQREEELRLLDEAAVSADAQTAAYAAGQRAEIAARMESEALAGAALEAMGETEYAVCCGAGILTLFLPERADTDGAHIRLIGAVSDQTGFAADSIKIILVKNET